jgi:hypothetical protein
MASPTRRRRSASPEPRSTGCSTSAPQWCSPGSCRPSDREVPWSVSHLPLGILLDIPPEVPYLVEIPPDIPPEVPCLV